MLSGKLIRIQSIAISTAVLSGIFTWNCFAEEGEAVLISNGGARIKSGYTLTAMVDGEIADYATFQYNSGKGYVDVTDDDNTEDSIYVITNAMANASIRAYAMKDGMEYLTEPVEVGDNLPVNLPPISAWNKPVEGSVETTSSDDKLTFEEKASGNSSYVLLDVKDDMVLLCTTMKKIDEPYYASTDQKVQILDINDPASIMYKANTEDFIARYILPESMQDYLLYNNWETETGSASANVAKMLNDSVINARVAPISANEYYKYRGILGYNDNGRGIAMRSPANTSAGNCKAVHNGGGTLAVNTDTSYYDWRFVFWVDKYVFENVKLTDAGANVVDKILRKIGPVKLLDMGYTEKELNGLGVDTNYPIASNARITGVASEGSLLSVLWDYSHTADYEEGIHEYQWFRVDSDGEKTEINGACERDYYVTADDIGFRLCCKVTPTDIKGTYGDTVFTGISEEVNDSSLSVAISDFNISGGTAEAAFRLGRTGDKIYSMFLITQTGHIVTDEAKEENDGDGEYILSASAGEDAYARAFVINKETGEPILLMTCGDMTSSDPADSELGITVDPINETYTIAGRIEGAENSTAAYISVRSAETGNITYTNADYISNGCISHILKFGSDVLPGMQNITITTDKGAKTVIIERFYSSGESKAKVLADLSPIVSSVQFAEIIKENYDILEINDKYIKAMNSKELGAIGEKLIGNSYTYDSISDFYSDIWEQSALYMISNGTDSAGVAEYYKGIFAFSECDMYAEFEKLKNKDRVFAMMKGTVYNTLGEVRSAFNKAVLLQMINEADSYGVIMNIFSQYGDGFDFSLAGYNSSDKTASARNLFNKGKMYTTMTELENALKDSISSSGKTTGSGGGGGGGGGGSSRVSATAPYVPITPSEESVTPIGSDNKESADVFEDVRKTHWAYESIKRLKEENIVSGDDEGMFNPEDNITREEYIKLLVEVFSVFDGNAVCEFEDVPQDHWAMQYIASAVTAGISNGIDDNMFGTGRNITRQDMAVMTYNALKPKNTEAEYEFADNDDISDYAIQSVFELAALNVINGFDDNSFRPRQTATRAQAAKIICSVLDLVLYGRVQ